MYSAHHAAARLRTLAFAVAFTCTALHAQSTSTLHGSILDPRGASVPSASIDLLDMSQSGGIPIAHATSSPSGTFDIPLPHPGRFALRVSAPGFQTTISPADFLSGSASLDVTLATQTLTQQVTVTANGTPTPEAQVGVAVTLLTADDYKGEPDVQAPLRLVSGVQVTQDGQIGGQTVLRIRGADSDANKIMLDGVPVGQIGGFTDISDLASTAIASIEVLHEPNSAIFGSDALAGVVNLTSARASTPLPLFTYAGDAGNFRTYRNELTIGEALRRFDLFSAFSRLDTRNNQVNDKFHNAVYAGNFGYTPAPGNDLRFTVRHISQSAGQPNTIAFYGIADDGQSKEQDSFYNVAFNSQTTPRWHNQIRYAAERISAQNYEFGATGISESNPIYANTYSYQGGGFNGLPVTLTGANGYATSGTAIFQYSSTPSAILAHTERDLGYLQSDLRITPHLMALGAVQYLKESGSNYEVGYDKPTVHLNDASYTLQLSGDLKRRLFYNLGSGFEVDGLFGFAATPRASLAFYLFAPSPKGIFNGTKLHGSFGKGIKEAQIGQQQGSLYTTLGLKLASQYRISPIGPEDSRTYDAGIEQELWNGRVRLGATYFHNQFNNRIEYIPEPAVLVLLGIQPTTANLSTYSYIYGAYVNSSALQSQGIEFESEYKVGAHLFARVGYTYTDARVQRSFSSDNYNFSDPSLFISDGPSFNTSSNFSTTPIGAFSPLVGARPFRVAPHSGYFALNYARTKYYASLSGTILSRRDDSTFLQGGDVNYGNSLLLPNRNLDGGYERLDLNAGYNLTPRVNLYTNIQNLLSQHYFEAFGYPSLPLTFRAGIKLNFGGESFKLD